ncbi:MAG TPA: VOC family protein [Nitrolancea sp.]|nr:VOC family protein [Nitrolancea sp.]
MKVLFVAGFGPVVTDAATAQGFYVRDLGLELEGDDDYQSTASLDGVKHFALWPLAHAAESCFGRADWPSDIPVPQGWIEFDVEDIATATAELEAQGYRLLQADKLEPWGQRVTRLLSPEGLLVGVTYTPHLRDGHE